MPPRVKALLLLGWSFIVTLVRRLVGSNKNIGIAQFQANYAADRLPPVSPSERESLGSFGGCIACGRCDLGEAQRIYNSAGEYRGVMQLMLGASRSMPDFQAASKSFAHIPDAVLAQKEPLCPARVPMRQIAQFVRDKAEEQRSA